MIVKHGTSSVFVFCRKPEGWRIGLIHHPLYGRMMLPGGHVEPGETAAEAALREVEEEAGLAVRLVSAPAAPLPAGYRPRRVAPPWWIVEHEVSADNHLGRAHIHVDHLYVAEAGDGHVSRPAHPFSWHAPAELAGLSMFGDSRLLATSLMSGLGGSRLEEGLLAGLLPAPG